MIRFVMEIFNRKRPFLAKLIDKKLLSKSGSEKEVMLFRFDMNGSNFVYEPGDLLAVIPTNDINMTNELLSKLPFDSESIVSVNNYQMTFKHAIQNEFYLQETTPKLLKKLLEKEVDSEKKKLLQNILLNEVDMKVFLYCHLTECAELFSHEQLTAQEYVESLKKIQPRLYSISSSQNKNPEYLELIVNVPKYLKKDKPFYGLASGFLANRVPMNLSFVKTFIAKSHFKLPDLSKNIIMIGPGVGIAPFKAFLEERFYQKTINKNQSFGENWLFFGEQRRSSDFIIEDFANEYFENGTLNYLDLAFSRDQNCKVYVQDRMIEKSQQIWNWISSNAYVYVCGDAKRMAKDVENVLLNIISSLGNFSQEMAIDYLSKMKKECRYQKDVY